MTKQQRKKSERLLRGIWERRGVPAIPPGQLKGLTDASVAELTRFWSFKDQHWDDANPPKYPY